MYTPIMATLRYGKLSNGDHIPLSYALETDDGRSIIFQSPNDFASLAYHLGAPFQDDGTTTDERIAQLNHAYAWLDANIGNQFDIANSYDELLE